MFGTFLIYLGIAAFIIFFFGFCIFIHELGHFAAAKWRGLHVIAFSIGFRKVWGFKYKGVDYRIGWIPFGGYVDLPQIDCTGQAKDENGNVLPPVKPSDRIITAFAGPLFNVFFGFFLGTFLWIHGIPQDTPRMTSFEIASVPEDCPEYKGGLRKGDVVQSLNGKRFNYTWIEFVEQVLYTVGEVELGVKRGNDETTVRYLPKANKQFMPEEGLGFPFFLPKIPVVLVPLAGSPAEKAGLKKNDIVLKVNGVEVNSFDEFFDRINENADKPMSFTIRRHGEVMEVGNITAVEMQESTYYRIGVAYDYAIPIVVKKAVAGSAAEKAGIRINDVIQKVNGKVVSSPQKFFNMIQQSKGDEMDFLVFRDGQPMNIKVTAKLIRNYDVGILPVFYSYPNPLQQLVDTIDRTIKAIRSMCSKQSTIKPKHMSGPIGIVNAIGKTVYYGGIVQALNLIVMITFSLGIFNLLPIPVLDGGHILLALIESVIRRPLPEKLIKPIFAVCIALLIGLMVFVTFYDMKRIYGDVSRSFLSSEKVPPPAASVKKEQAPAAPSASEKEPRP